MKQNLLTLITFLYTLSYYTAQVGINTDQPKATSSLHVSERKNINATEPDVFNGVLIQRYSTTERNYITYDDPPTNTILKLSASDNGLTIYNTTENCYNYWNGSTLKWQKLCGTIGPATLDITAFNCSNDIEINGKYNTNTPVTSSEYIKVKVNVTELGSYDFKAYANPHNGYSYSATGEFTTTGIQFVVMYANGLPTNAQTDTFKLTLNGAEVCPNIIKVNVTTAIKPLSNIKLLDIGDQGESAFAFATTWFSAFMNSWSNFGPIPASKVQTDGSPLAPVKLPGSTSAMSTLNQYNIIAVSYRIGVDIDAAQATNLAAWLNADPTRTLILHTEAYGTNTINLLNNLIGNGNGGPFNLVTSDFTSINSAGNTAATGATWETSNSANDPFLKGIFGDVTGTVFLDHLSSTPSILKSKLDQSNNIQYLAVNYNATIPSQNTVSVFKIKNKNVFWIEDGAPFFGSFTPSIGPACFSPLVGTMGATPIKCNPSGGTNSDNSGGSIFAANMVHWALQQIQ